jgi:transcriptional regulator with XRE-family HTH domain
MKMKICFPLEPVINRELVVLGDNIRMVRQSLHVSQEAMADMCDLHRTYMCDLHRTYMCDIERGKRNVSFCSLLKLGRGLGTTVSELTRNVESGVRPQSRFSNQRVRPQPASIRPSKNAHSASPASQVGLKLDISRRASRTGTAQTGDFAI